MERPGVVHGHEVVNLISDDEDDGFSDDSAEFYDMVDEVAVDLSAIPDEDVPPSQHRSQNAEDLEPAGLIMEATCLQLVLNVLPDVSIDHVLAKIRQHTTDLTRTREHSERIINELLEGTYPREADAVGKKRRRQDSEGASDYERDENAPGELSYHKDAADLLKDEFLRIPEKHITKTLKQQKTLFKAYILLEKQLRNYREFKQFVKTPRPRNKRGIELAMIQRGSQLPKELRAAKQKVEKEAAKRIKVEETKQAEETNLQQAKRSKQMGECQCCFAEYPLNRMISCHGEDMHLFCMDCPKQYIETEMGQSKCRPLCFANTECKGTFSRAQLQQILGEKSFDRLEHMQQQEDIAAAGLDSLSECPFCDYKAECLPVEVDREFRCQNTKCGKTSCRLCNKETHIPLSCEEAKKDGQLTLRHVVEEAMSAALIRKCNKCKHPFIKELGCNKMSCSHCGNKQCYICSKNLVGYEHFGDPVKGHCALHDNVEDVHEREVKKAADEAMAQVKAENPNLSDADLMVQVSDRVKQSEAARKGRAAEQMNQFPYHMVGDRLAHRHDLPEDRPHGRIGRLQIAPLLDPLDFDEPRHLRLNDPFFFDDLEELGPRYPRVNPQAAPQQRARIFVNDVGVFPPYDMPDLNEHVRMMQERGRRMDRMNELLNQQARYRDLMLRRHQDFARPQLFPPPAPPLLPDFGFGRIGAGAQNAQRNAHVGGGLAFEGVNVPRHRRV